MVSLFKHIPQIPYHWKIRIIALFTLVIPIQIFVIGNFYGSGFQTSLFRYDDTMFGTFITLLSRDLYNVMTGYDVGLGALAIILWIIAACILILNVVLLFIGTADFSGSLRRAGKLIGISALLFLLSIVLQYGPLFHNMIGISIPLGLPLLVLIGFWMYLEGAKEHKTLPEEEEGNN